MKSFTGVGLVAFSFLAASQTYAAEYSVTPFANATAEYDTNRNLSSVNEKSTFGMLFDAGALFAYQSEKTALSITPKFAVNRYTDDDSGIDQDRENYYLDANAQHRFNERWSAGATFGFSNVGVVAAELEDLGLVVDDINNQVTESFSRKTITFGPSVTYILSERDSLRFGAGYTEATYDNNNTLLSDYTNYSINGSWIRRISEKGQLTTSVFASIQDPELNNQVLGSSGSSPTASGVHNVPDPDTLKERFEQFGFTVAYAHNFNETLLGTLSLGGRKTDGQFADLIDYNYLLQNGAIITRSQFDVLGNLNPDLIRGARITERVYDQGDVSNTGVLFDVSLEKTYERTIYTVRLSRSSVPSGTGITDVDQYSLSALHQFSDRLEGTADFRYISTQSESERTLSEGFAQSSDQIRLEAGLNYRLTEFWTVGSGYSYRQRSPEDGDTADSHAVFLQVGYNGRRYAKSR
jgi:hypothetical protein